MWTKAERNRIHRILVALIWGICPAMIVNAGVMVPGGVAGGGAAGSAGGSFTFDSGADQTLISRSIATDMGLLIDANNDGTPDLADGMKQFNSGEIDTWCFDNVSVAAIDSVGNNCVVQTTVYVSKNNDSWGSANLLGKPWQNAVDACYRAKTNTVKWPWEQPQPQAPKKAAVPKADGATGGIKSVFEGIVWGSGGVFAPLDMAFYSGSQFSIIPGFFAGQLGAPPVIGQVDLSIEDPDLLEQMSMGNQNLTQQTIFNVVEIELRDLNLTGGFPLTLPPQPLQVLVSDDLNSQFGIMGDNMLQFTDGINEFLWTGNDAFGQEALYFADLPQLLPGDLDGDGFVGITDLNIVLGNWNQFVPPADPLADPSGDGFVGIEDLNTVLGNWNAGIPPAQNASIPEPTAVVLLGLCAATLITRRT